MLGALSLSGRHLQSGYRPRRLIGCRCRRSTQKATGDQIAIEGITTDAPSVFFAASFASPTPLRSPLKSSEHRSRGAERVLGEVLNDSQCRRRRDDKPPGVKESQRRDRRQGSIGIKGIACRRVINAAIEFLGMLSGSRREAGDAGVQSRPHTLCRKRNRTPRRAEVREPRRGPPSWPRTVSIARTRTEPPGFKSGMR